MLNVGILNYGLGNVTAFANFLDYCAIKNSMISDPSEKVDVYDAIVIPGVGAFDEGIKRIKKMEFDKMINDSISKTKIIGICLGMHLLFDGSEEGSENGLGLIGGTVKKIDSFSENSIPNIGWRKVSIEKSSKLWMDSCKFYFNHSFGLIASESDYVLGKTYGEKEIVAIVKKNEIYGFQFHPERSHIFGRKLFSNIFDQ